MRKTEELVNLLSKNSYQYDELLEKLNLSKDEAKEMLRELTKNKQIYIGLDESINLVKDTDLVGTLDSNSRGEKYVKINNQKIFISNEHLHTALKYDLVVVENYENNQGKVLGIINRQNKSLVCEVISKNRKLMLVPFNAGCDVTIEVNDKMMAYLVEGDRVNVILDTRVDADNIIIVRNMKKIGHKDDPNSDELAIAISKDFDVEFSEMALMQAESIPNVVLEADKLNRVDLTKENIFTIDSIHTKDMDDAISIKRLDNGNYELMVHIADVAHYVKINSPIFNEAAKRATSLYLGDTVIPMIPHKLSNGICSLNEGVERLTKSVKMEINKSGKVVSYELFDAVIKSKKKMTYEELNQMFNGEEVDESYYPFYHDLQLMRELSNILNITKKKRGNINFESNEVHIENNEGELQFITRRQDEAEELIENFMIIANETVATHFKWLDMPFIYRVHNIPNEFKLEETMELIQNIMPKLIRIKDAYGQKEIQNILKSCEGTPEYSIISNLLLRNMAKAKYSTSNIGHFALALDNYCHSTSPIRRLPDLMIQHSMNLFNDYNIDSYEFLKEELEKLSYHASYKERQANDAEKDYLKVMMAKYMSEHIGEYFEGTIIDIDNSGVLVKLDNNVRGLLAYTDEFSKTFFVDYTKKELRSIHSKTKAKLGCNIIIKVDSVNIPLKEIYFELIEIQKNHELVRTKHHNKNQ